MNANPDISIIVPVYNGADSIEASIESLLRQTLESIEIIIINDASSDQTETVVSELAKRDRRIKAINSPQNIGVHEARALGVKNSQSPWVGFLDADDFALPNMYERLLSAAKESRADIVICGSRLVSSEREFIKDKIRFLRSETLDSNIFERFCKLELGTGALWNKIYRRELIETCATRKFPFRQNAAEDTIVNVGCFLKAKTVHTLPEQLHDYVANDQSATLTADSGKSFMRILQGYAISLYLYHKEYPEALDLITLLYAKQLHFSAYKVSDIDTLKPYEKELQQSLEIILNTYPAGLAAVANKYFGKNAEESPSPSNLWNNWITATKRLLKGTLRRPQQ